MLSARLRCRGNLRADRILNHVGEPDQRAAAVRIGWVGLLRERYNQGVRGARDFDSPQMVVPNISSLTYEPDGQCDIFADSEVVATMSITLTVERAIHRWS